MKILVTAFEPYATHPVNASKQIVERMHFDNVKTVVLPVEYDKARKMILKEIDSFKPEAIICLALSPFITRPSLEQYAYNEMDSVQADESGVVKTKEAVYPGEAPSLRAGFDIFSIQQYILSQGEKCDISVDPGRFVANAVFYEAARSGVPSLFVHVPQEINYPVDETYESIEKIFEYLDY